MVCQFFSSLLRGLRNVQDILLVTTRMRLDKKLGMAGNKKPTPKQRGGIQKLISVYQNYGRLSNTNFNHVNRWEIHTEAARVRISNKIVKASLRGFIAQLRPEMCVRI
jgi:hypothetical protein